MAKWEDELERWLTPFLDRLGHKTRQRMARSGLMPRRLMPSSDAMITAAAPSPTGVHCNAVSEPETFLPPSTSSSVLSYCRCALGFFAPLRWFFTATGAMSSTETLCRPAYSFVSNAKCVNGTMTSAMTFDRSRRRP